MVRLYELQTGKLLATASGHTALVVGLEFAGPSGLLVSASSEGSVLAWKLPSLPGVQVKVGWVAQRVSGSSLEV